MRRSTVKAVPYTSYIILFGDDTHHSFEKGGDVIDEL